MTDPIRLSLSRRHLMSAGAGAAIALSAGRAAAQQAEGQPLMGDPELPMRPGERMRWAIVGLGTYAVGQVLPSFGDAHRSRMTAFVSGNRDKAERLGRSYGVDRFYGYDDYDRIASDDQIDCVYIVLPVGLHAEYTIRALEAGKHVLCEKPMASTSAECERMIAAARANGRQLGVAYRVHFEPNNLHARQRIADDLGVIRHVSAEHGFDINPEFPPHKWRLERALAGGGSMYDIGIYGLNTSLMMLKEDPVSVSALYSTPAGDPRFSEVEGGLDWQLRMPSGISVSGTSSYCIAPYVSRQRYSGSKAALEMQPATTYDDNRIRFLGEGQPPQEYAAGNAAAQFAAQLDGFSMAARSGTAHRTPGEMGLRDIRIIEAMYRSADADGAAIPLSV